MIEPTEIRTGIDQELNQYTVTLKIKGIYFEATAYSETEQQDIFKKFKDEIKK